ncbi:uncharacterized protein TRIADDRAFT_57909 [Trichoplax adhaerens]|uniref:Uncharacterized protein n=1 Tax=Trichoplax adhaerens TaxID=10228 RepID=B3S233_TRIAD|nr:predicted protein [Trichoplax adhaerens]EDV23362.1 predicted protein [Trichoplax adhaerens]|eukprot:XP_002114272.1 predicted protein [Trichoplax adhaerens]
MALIRYFALLSILIAIVIGCQPPDCKNVDCGTCGNACCTLMWSFTPGKSAADKIYQLMVTNFMKGGADHRYKFVKGSNLTTFKNPENVQYLLQAIHRTKVHKYNDTLNIAIYKMDNSTSVAKGFSISQIAGAYCDHGQNYKNLVGFVKGLGTEYNTNRE